MYTSKGREVHTEGTVGGSVFSVCKEREETRVDGAAWVRGRRAGDKVGKQLGARWTL